jgi:Ser/Thr protein kinase RdoA (MazF antagonist)
LTPLLAPDAALPQRDVLLDETCMARVLERRLGLNGSLTLSRCEIARVKYRVGESLRVRYRIETGGRVYEVACRAFTPGRGAPAYRRARERVVPTGALRPVGWAPELETVFWTFPNDRKLRLRAVSELPVLVGPHLRALRLVAYAPEKSATLRCDGDDGAVAFAFAFAFAKVYSGDEAERTLLLHRRLTAARLPVPRPLSSATAHRLLVVAAVPGRPLAELAGAELVRGHRLLGAAVARMHDLPPPDAERFRRLEPDRVHSAAELVARVRPDVADAARHVAAQVASLDWSGPLVCLHGDLHPKNALVDGDRIALVDLDQTAGGAPAGDLGSHFAGLRYARIAGGLDAAVERACATAFSEGYSAVRQLPPARELRAGTAAALLAERVVRAINRVRPEGLAALGPLLAKAGGLLDA